MRQPPPSAPSPSASSPSGREAPGSFPLAFAILAHGDLDHLARLVTRLSACPADTVVLHLDRRVAKGPRRQFLRRVSGSGNVLCAPPRRCYWGGWSLVDATCRCIDRLAESGRDFRYLSLLSGLDYPIRTIEDFRSFLSSSAGAEFIAAHHMAWEHFIRRGFTAERYEYRFPFARDALHPLLFSIWQAAVERLDRRRSLPDGVLPYGGSQWWTLSAEAIGHLRQPSTRARLEAAFRWAFVPDEHAFQAALMASPLRDRIAHETLRYVPLLPEGGPEWIDPGNVGRALASGKFFARKILPARSASTTEAVDAALRGTGRSSDPGSNPDNAPGGAPGLTSHRNTRPLQGQGQESPSAAGNPLDTRLRRFLKLVYTRFFRPERQPRLGGGVAGLPLRESGRRIVMVAEDLAEQAAGAAESRHGSGGSACFRFGTVPRGDAGAPDDFVGAPAGRRPGVPAAPSPPPQEVARALSAPHGTCFVVARNADDVSAVIEVLRSLAGPTELYLDLHLGESRQTRNAMIDDALTAGLMLDNRFRDRRFLRLLERRRFY